MRSEPFTTQSGMRATDVTLLALGGVRTARGGSEWTLGLVGWLRRP
jgi:hypothetical protein